MRVVVASDSFKGSLAAALGRRYWTGPRRSAGSPGFDAALRAADLVITGEGRYDATSAQGKVTGMALVAARQAGVAAALDAGVIDGTPPAGLADAVSLATECYGLRATPQ